MHLSRILFAILIFVRVHFICQHKIQRYQFTDEFLINTMCSKSMVMFQVEMLYQRYFLRMNQSNMTHVLGLLVGLALALGLLLVTKLVLTGNQPLFTSLQRPENLSLAVTLVTCIAVYIGKIRSSQINFSHSTFFHVSAIRDELSLHLLQNLSEDNLVSL